MARLFNSLRDTGWLKQKPRGIYGSEAAAACGVDGHMSALELWARKTERWNSETKCESEQIQLCKDLKPYITLRFSQETGKRTQYPEGVYCHDMHEFILADIDREIVGENACLECRTASSAFEGLPENFEELPPNMLAQCYHYLAVMNYERVYLALLDLFSGELRIYEIPYDHKKCEGLLACEARFWNDNVIADIRPKPDGSDSAGEALKRLIEPIHGDELELSEHSESVGELYELRKRIKEFEAREKLLRQELIDAMDGNSSAVTEKFRLNFTRQNRKIIDTKALKEAHSEIYSECLRDSAADILKITEL